MKKKKDKKGFTLVELLIVLGIICVLALIITPIIINYRNKANDVYNDKLKESVISVAKDYYTNNRSELPNGYPEGKYATFVTLDKLKQNNLFSNDVIDAYKNNCSSESYVVVENNRGNYNYYACLKCGDKTYETDKSYCDFRQDKDGKAPTCSLTYNDGWNKENVLITITSTDTVGVINIKNNGKVLKTTYDKNNKTYNATYEASESGKYSFDILNKYGLKTTCETKNDIKIDRDSPSCSITKQDITNTSLNLFVDALDKTSGIKSIEMGEKTLGTDNLYKVTVNGKYVATVIDNAGNVGTCEIVVDEFDKTPPVITFGIEGTNGEIATSTCEDPESGIIGEAIVKQTLTGNKDVIVTRTCKNNVGLETTASHTYKYNSCKTGSNTCSYGCGTTYDSCATGSPNECVGGYDTIIRKECVKNPAGCKTCQTTVCTNYNWVSCPCGSPGQVGPGGSGHSNCWCQGDKCVRYGKQTVTNCSICGYNYKEDCYNVEDKKWNSCKTTKNTCQGGYVTDSSTCSNCYYGSNTCKGGWDL